MVHDMAKGVLGIIICPMMNDELLHYICNDPDVARTIILDNDFSSDLKAKMDSRGHHYELIPESDFYNGRVVFDRNVLNIVIRSNNLALHAEPKDLKRYVEEEIEAIQPFVDALGLYYGLCGNYGWDLTEWATRMGYKPVAVFRGTDGKVVDDCVAVVVGGSDRYLQLEKRYTGMFYLTPAIADNWIEFVSAGDLGKQLANIPKETLEELGIFSDLDYMRWMFEIGHYQHILKMDTGLEDSERFNRKAEEIGKVLNLKPIDIESGWITLQSAEGIYTQCKKNLPV